MKTVFADTYYYIALLSPKDSAHARAVELTAQLQPAIVTTAWVLTELAAAMSSPSQTGAIRQTIRWPALLQ